MRFWLVPLPALLIFCFEFHLRLKRARTRKAGLKLDDEIARLKIRLFTEERSLEVMTKGYYAQVRKNQALEERLLAQRIATEKSPISDQARTLGGGIA